MKVVIEIGVSSIGEAADLCNALRALGRDGVKLHRGSLPKGLTIKEKRHLRSIGAACEVVSEFLRFAVDEAKL